MQFAIMYTTITTALVRTASVAMDSTAQVRQTLIVLRPSSNVESYVPNLMLIE